MFNSHFGEFEEDPFFSDPFRVHREHMRHMMRSFSEPFGAPLIPTITDGRSRRRNVAEDPGSSLALRNEHRGVMENPFNRFDNMMANVRNRMEEMNRSFENMPTASNTHSFSSSSVMTYSKVGNEPPKVYQATSSTIRAPGGIKETRQAVKDSESGLQKMRIGHHIQDRGRVVEKKYNNKTGEKEFNQDFQNMDEAEAQSFDDEWQEKVSQVKPSGPMPRLMEAQPRAAHRAAITSPEHTHREQKRKPGIQDKTKGPEKRTK